LAQGLIVPGGLVKVLVQSGAENGGQRVVAALEQAHQLTTMDLAPQVKPPFGQPHTLH
jgi:hypothetical protein